MKTYFLDFYKIITYNSIKNNKYDPTFALDFNLTKELLVTITELFHNSFHKIIIKTYNKNQANYLL